MPRWTCYEEREFLPDEGDDARAEPSDPAEYWPEVTGDHDDRDSELRTSSDDDYDREEDDV